MAVNYCLKFGHNNVCAEQQVTENIANQISSSAYLPLGNDSLWPGVGARSANVTTREQPLKGYAMKVRFKAHNSASWRAQLGQKLQYGAV